MSTPFDVAREQARQDNGQFGAQPKAEADGVVLDTSPDLSGIDTADLGRFLDAADGVDAAAAQAQARFDLTDEQTDALKVELAYEEVEEHLIGLGLYEPYAESDDDGGYYVSTPSPHYLVSLELPNDRSDYIAGFHEDDDPFAGFPLDDEGFTVGAMRAVRAEANHLYETARREELLAHPFFDHIPADLFKDMPNDELAERLATYDASQAENASKAAEADRAAAEESARRRRYRRPDWLHRHEDDNALTYSTDDGYRASALATLVQGRPSTYYCVRDPQGVEIRTVDRVEEVQETIEKHRAENHG